MGAPLTRPEPGPVPERDAVGVVPLRFIGGAERVPIEGLAGVMPPIFAPGTRADDGAAPTERATSGLLYFTPVRCAGSCRHVAVPPGVPFEGMGCALVCVLKVLSWLQLTLQQWLFQSQLLQQQPDPHQNPRPNDTNAHGHPEYQPG
jgi:hypothetical protein